MILGCGPIQDRAQESREALVRDNDRDLGFVTVTYEFVVSVGDTIVYLYPNPTGKLDGELQPDQNGRALYTRCRVTRCYEEWVAAEVEWSNEAGRKVGIEIAFRLSGLVPGDGPREHKVRIR